ncbi:MAG TPA: hypothetical protein VD948_00435, partial [Rhodothermales bacterium]|nr:hypothetical protein [Rhodothermales bacterium]
MARLLLLLLLVLPVSPTFAQAPCEIGTASDTLDANNVRASLYNNGLLFSNRSGNIYNVPKAPPGQPIQPNALWVANLWFGGYIGSKLVNATTGYATGQFNPGPLNPQGRPFSDCTRYDRIFKVTLADIQALRTGTITEAVRAWPWAWGAPVSDGDGVPDNYNLGGSDRPELMGTESHWWVMNAMGPHGRRDSFPLEVQVTAFAMPSLPTFQARIPAIYNSTLYRYRLLWRG